MAVFNPSYPLDIPTVSGFINSKLILSIVFISVLLPSALFMKLFGYDPLRQKKSFISSYKENNKNHKIDFTRIF